MISQTAVESALLTWLQDFIEVPHPSLGNWAPCPFARQARLNKTYDIKEGTNVITDGILLADNWDTTKEVVIFWYNDIAVDRLVNLTRELNQQIMPKNLVALEGHPELKETINGIDLRFPLCPVVIVQRLDELNQASARLKSKGYYDTWNRDNLDKIVNFRITTS